MKQKKTFLFQEKIQYGRFFKMAIFFASFSWKSSQIGTAKWMGQNFDIFTGFQQIPCNVVTLLIQCMYMIWRPPFPTTSRTCLESVLSRMQSYFSIERRSRRSLKFIYYQKATQFCEISTLLLTTVQTVKSQVEISQNFVAFSEYLNFKNSQSAF